jgi:hypothetical protein
MVGAMQQRRVQEVADGDCQQSSHFNCRLHLFSVLRNATERSGTRSSYGLSLARAFAALGSEEKMLAGCEQLHTSG